MCVCEVEDGLENPDTRGTFLAVGRQVDGWVGKGEVQKVKGVELLWRKLQD